jgi:pyruvate formate lyase activating enzyme
MTSTGTRDPVWTEAILGSPGPDGSVHCELCPFRCALPPGRMGNCGVRLNQGGRLVTATKAVSVAHLDAIERKPFFHVLPGSQVLTLAAPGCTFRCTYCINHRLSQYGREDVGWTAEPAVPADLVARARSAGAAIGLSYSEPGLAPELTLALAELARPLGIPVLWKTNGFLTPAAIELMAPVLTAVNIDVKAADDVSHRRLTGASLGPVLDAVERFRAAGVWVEVSTPLVPGTAASPHQLRAIAARLAAVDPDLPWHLLRFTPDFRLTDAPPTSPAALETGVTIGREAGLRFVYVERALGPGGRRTSCPVCDTALVERGIWTLNWSAISDGACPACRTPVPGVWSR